MLTCVPDQFHGTALQEHKEVLHVRYPITHGIVTNWTDMEHIWDYVFDKQLKLFPKDRPLLITEAALNPKSNRQMMLQVLFETFQVPAMAVANPGLLSIMGMGRVSAVALECGDGVCEVLPIYEGMFYFVSLESDLIIGQYSFTEQTKFNFLL